MLMWQAVVAAGVVSHRGEAAGAGAGVGLAEALGVAGAGHQGVAAVSGVGTKVHAGARGLRYTIHRQRARNCLRY